MSAAKTAVLNSIVVTEPPWDSLAHPLQIPAYYVNISSEQQFAQATLRIDVYKNGEIVRSTNSGTQYFTELQPIEMGSAIYFKKSENNRSGFFVTTFGKDRDTFGMSSFILELPDMANITRVLYRPYSEIDPNGTTPLFAIACNADYYRSTSKTMDPTMTADYLIRHFGQQKDVLLLVVSLEASQEIKEFKPAPEQP